MVKTQTLWFVGIAAVVLVIAMGGFQAFGIGEQDALSPEAKETAACNIDDQIGVRTITENPFARGTNVDVLTYLYTTDGYRVDNADDQSNLDASPNTVYTVFAFDDASTGAAAGSDSYGVIREIDTDCKDPFDIYLPMYAEGAPTFTVYNDDGSVNADTSNEQTMAADNQYEVEMKVKAPNDAAYGAPESDVNIAVCFNYNTSAYDEVKIEGATKVSVPSFDVATSEECWELDRNTFKDDLETGREDETYTILIDTDNTNAPSSDDITIRLMDSALFIHSETGLPMYGLSDDDGDDVGDAVANDATLYVA